MPSWHFKIISVNFMVPLYIVMPALNASRTSLVAQMVKNPSAVQETQVRFLGWEDPLEKGMATHSSILAWKIPWTHHGVAKSWTRLSDFASLQIKQELLNSNAVFLEVHNSCLLAWTRILCPPEQQGHCTEFTQLFSFLFLFVHILLTFPTLLMSKEAMKGRSRGYPFLLCQHFQPWVDG